MLGARATVSIEQDPQQRHHAQPAQRPDVKVGAGQKQQRASQCAEQDAAQRMAQRQSR